MSYKNFDKQIGEKLRTYNERPSVDVFARIEKSLADAPAPAPMPAPKPRRSTLYRISGYSAIAAAVILGVILLLRRGDETRQTPEYAVENILKKTGASTVDVPKLIAESQQRATDAEGRLTDQKNIAEVIREVIAEDYALAVWQPAISAETESETATADPAVAEVKIDPAPKQQPAANEIKSFAQASTEANARRKQFERERNIENYWAEAFSDDNRKYGRGSKRRSMGMSLYAGNFGTGTGDMVYKDQASLVGNNMFVSESSVSIPGKSAASNGPMRAQATTQENEATLRHNMPLNFGISLTYPLTERLSLASGVNYSYLYSFSRQSLRSGDVKTMQELHYVGIPVGVLYSFYSGRRVDFYVRGGCQLEKAVSAVKKYEYESEQQSTADQGGKMGVKGFQPSVDAAAGTNIKITKGMGLYIEPGVAYYFERADQPSSYRTENPTNFTVRIGVRFDL